MAGVNLDNNVSVEIGIDNKTLPAGSQNVIMQVSVIEHALFVTPMMEVILNDSENVLEAELALTDQNLISVFIGRTQDDAAERLDFRMFNKANSQYQHGQRQVIRGLIDAPTWVQGVGMKSYKGTSSDTLKKLVQENGLRVGRHFQQTSDEQVWLNPGLSVSRFVNQLESHSYASATGLMKFAVNADKTVCYRDVIAAQFEQPTAKFVFGDPKALGLKGKNIWQVHEAQDQAASGFVNSWMSYGYNMRETRLDGKSHKSDGISLELDNAYVPYNQDTYDQVGAARNDYVPLDVGNTHENYWAALHSNMRKAALFTQFIRVTVYQKTPVRVLDVIEYIPGPMQRDDPMTKAKAGKYVVLARKQFMQNNRYAEFFLFARIGHTLKGETKLLSGNGKGSPTPQPIDEGEKAGKSDWTYVKEKRAEETNSRGKIYGCTNIVDEECMPTSSRSTEFDEDDDFTDGKDRNGNGAYRVALTRKTGTIKSREKDTKV